METIRNSLKILILLLAISILINTASACENQTIEDNLTASEVDTPDLIINITNDNIYDYFKSNNISSQYNEATIILGEDFEDLGVLTIKARNLTIDGNNHTLKNTVFSIEANGVVLNNLTLNVTDSFDDNENSALLVYRSSNVTISNVNINYDVPRDVDAYGIYSLATKWILNENLKIINTTINFNAGNRDMGRDYAIKLEYSPNAVLSNNIINAALPLRTIAFIGTTAYLESEFALAVGISNCNNLSFINNILNTSVNIRPECANPTLDSIFICDSDDCKFINNTMYQTDFITYPDEANYLYSLDIYRTNNLLVEGNNINVETTGGAYAAGTAYPIQLTGPAGGIIIRYNNISSKSNGPNIGIYSQNFNGENYITILNNIINVTGWAGNHSWALVAGIEAQDDNDIIMNNIIEIHNTHTVSQKDNLYGISYSQKTDSKHTYRVVNNTVISDGYYLAHMLDADNTTVTNNTLVRTDKYSDTNYDPFKRGDAIGEGTDEAKNNDFSGNRVITIFEYELEHQSNEIDGGEEFHYEIPQNVNNISNVIYGSGIAPVRPGFPNGNPLIPGSTTGGVNMGNGGGNNGFGIPDVADGDPTYTGLPNLNGDDGKSLSRKHATANVNTQNSFNDEGTSSNSYNNQIAHENATSSKTPSISGVASSGKASSSQAGSTGSAGGGSVSSRAYEITKEITEDDNSLIKFIGFAVACEILLIIGFRFKKGEEY